MDMRTNNMMKEWEGYTIQLLPIEKLIQVCPTDTTEKKRDFTKRVYQSLKTIGLSVPLVTVKLSSIKQLKRWYRFTKGRDMMPPSTWQKHALIAVFGGNTRLTAAKQLKFTHIDCIIMAQGGSSIRKNIKEIYRVQGLQHKYHTELYG